MAKVSIFILFAYFVDLIFLVVRFPSREQRSHEKKSAGPFDIGGKQQELHLDIANETGARDFTQRAATMPINQSLSANTLAVPFGVIPEEAGGGENSRTFP
ncbi:hypothetical protein AVEN_44138-1 [Araneus ventricosus]|uniref:Uncharacterized protein n=1 Tax=Araneus ventricosus TaxID=182803 RepID=A0A4Y2DCY0_ARAVE|nr:hypothetical protein AVEN_44138-1 [Araneus ventricosus]